MIASIRYQVAACNRCPCCGEPMDTQAVYVTACPVAAFARLSRFRADGFQDVAYAIHVPAGRPRPLGVWVDGEYVASGVSLALLPAMAANLSADLLADTAGGAS